jgi:hypothetical protein
VVNPLPVKTLAQQLGEIGVYLICENISLEPEVQEYNENLKIKLVPVASLMRKANVRSLEAVYREKSFHDLGQSFCPIKFIYDICVQLVHGNLTAGNCCYLLMAPIGGKDGRAYVLQLDRTGDAPVLRDVPIDNAPLLANYCWAFV